MMMYSTELYEEFPVVGQVFLDFEEDLINSTYLTYDNLVAGIRIKYPSGWNVLEELEISGNSILVDFYHTGINETSVYSENANVIVSSRDGYVVNPVANSEIPVHGAIQPTLLNPTSLANVSDILERLNEFTDATISNLRETLAIFTLLESDSTIISGLPAHEITYTIAGNQSEIKQTQAWTSKDDKWFAIMYSAEPLAYYNPNTARDITRTFLIR